jgi:phosphinothricin acetyltransferase
MDSDIRLVAPSDMPAITAIFNDAVLHTTGSFDSTPKSEDDFTQRFFEREKTYPHLVYIQNAAVVGWASIGPYSDRCAYGDTGEISIYIAPSAKGMGVGTKLLGALVTQARALPIHSLIARIGEGNPASLALHRRVGFSEIGFLKEIGMKFGKRLGVHIFQLMLRPS